MKVLIPMIRKLYLEMLADDIVTVQPMMIDTQTWLQSREEPFNIYPYIAQRHNSLWDQGFPAKVLEDMTDWCEEILESNSWHYVAGNFYFRNENDRTMFLMKFS